MDVTGTVHDPLSDQQVDELDDGGVFNDFAHRVQRLLLLFYVNRRGQIIEIGIGTVEPVNRSVNITRSRHDHPNIHTGAGANIVASHHVAWIAHGHYEPVVLDSDRQDAVAATHLAGNPSDDGRVHHGLTEVNERQADLLSQRLNQLRFAQQPLVDQDPAQHFSGFLLHLHGAL